MRHSEIRSGTVGTWLGLLTLTTILPQGSSQAPPSTPTAPTPVVVPAAPTPLPPPIQSQNHPASPPIPALPAPGQLVYETWPLNAPMLPATAQSNLPRFDLDFPGGMPASLIDKIVQSMGGPLNVIIPPEFANTEIPPLKLRHVTVPNLFSALERASSKRVKMVTGYQAVAGSGTPTPVYSWQNRVFGFRSQTPNDPDTVWYFYCEGSETPEEPPQPPVERVARFYQLAPYLGTLKVEDITTAVQTSWKLLGKDQLFGQDRQASLTFHKETKLLIAVGRSEQLQVIDDILAALPREGEGRPKMDAAFMRRYGLIPGGPAPAKKE